jgi:hypothetical protein
VKVKLVSVHNHGDFDKEYVLLRVDEDTDVGRYVVADSTYTSDGKVSNKLRHTYWFPDKVVKKGDYVVLYTRSGTAGTGTTNMGAPLHRFYWDLQTAVWNDTGDSAVLLELNTWQFLRARP